MSDLQEPLTLINSLEEAVRIAKRLIEKNTQDKVVQMRLLNKQRHCLLLTEKGLKYYVLFKRQFFMSFGKIFNLSGCGDSVNAEYLGKALNMAVHNFLFIYQNGYVYAVAPEEIHTFGQEFGTIRVTKETNERTYSFPLKVERRWR